MWELVLSGLLAILLLLLPVFCLRLSPERSWAKIVAGIAMLVSLGVLGMVALTTDVLMAAPHSLSLCLAVTAVATAVNVPLVRRFHAKVGGVLVAAYCVAFAVYNYGDTDLKAFKQHYAQVHVGMTEQEAATAMGQEFNSDSNTKQNFSLSYDGTNGLAHMFFTFPSTPRGSYPTFDASINLVFKDGCVPEKFYEYG